MTENALILFMKLPSPGKVKTRLEKDLGAGLVFELYNAFITDILNTFKNADADIIVVYSPDSDAEYKYRDLLSKYHSFEQRGSDLGERMYNAFNDTYLAGYRRAILVGSDIPSVKIDAINLAFKRLDDYDITIGPSADGGYYLIGNSIKSSSSIYFKDIEWSRSDVYEKTVLKAVACGFSIYRTEITNDIDDLSGLVHFYETNRNNLQSESIKVIMKNIDKILKGGNNEI